jgi:cell wall assembly regulator SMI1
MSWRERITDVYSTRTCPPGIAGRPDFYPPASEAQLADAEAALGAALPDSLRSLLKETDGVMDMLALDGGEWFESMWLLWAIGELVQQNRYYRAASQRQEYERDFDGLVFFADAGTDGIRFAFPVEDGVCAPLVLIWHPIMDRLSEAAPSLDAFLRGWLTGSISV